MREFTSIKGEIWELQINRDLNIIPNRTAITKMIR